MARPKHYAKPTVTRSLSLSADAEKELQRYAKKSKQTLSATASELILRAFGKEPAKAEKPAGGM